jgi:hypothetical protein
LTRGGMQFESRKEGSPELPYLGGEQEKGIADRSQVSQSISKETV